MSKVPLPGAGCFTATYPNFGWLPTPCKTAPQHRFRPARKTPILKVGNGTDYVAEAPAGHLIFGAQGSFMNISSAGPLGETDSESGDSSAFSLQINSNRFSLPSPPPKGCSGPSWQQFVFQNEPMYDQTGLTAGSNVFIQYWLNGCETCPPPNYPAFSSTDDARNCYMNSPTISCNPMAIANLPNLSLVATATANGNDSVMLIGDPGCTSALASPDSTLNLAANWTEAEFNVFGLVDSSQAMFGPGTSITVVNTLFDGTTNLPSCVGGGFTGESNSLYLVGPCLAFGAQPNGIFFTESNVPSTCPRGSAWNPANGTCSSLSGGGGGGRVGGTECTDGIFLCNCGRNGWPKCPPKYQAQSN